VLSFRVKWSRMISTGLLGSARKGGISPAPPMPGRSSSVLSSLGLPFDPYDHTPLPSRILATGAAANFPSVANLVGDIFNAPVFVPSTQVDSAQVVPHRNAPAKGFAARAALGSSYVARWVWGKEWGAGGLSVFEDEMKRLLGKRWVATGGVPLRTNVNAPGVIMAGLNVGGSSGANSGTSTPYGTRSGLGATVFVEEEEDEELERERQRQNSVGSLSPGIIGGGLYSPSPFGDIGFGTRMRTQMNSTLESLSSSGPVPSTAYTTPDLNVSMVGSGGAANGSVMTPTTPTPLTPVVALPTADIETQIGLAKVAEPDLDAFMAYAAIVPEYCRLEGMMIKGIV
jgi:xylulokinase